MKRAGFKMGNAYYLAGSWVTSDFNIVILHSFHYIFSLKLM